MPAPNSQHISTEGAEGGEQKNPRPRRVGPWTLEDWAAATPEQREVMKLEDWIGMWA